ncbi:MAG: ABC transporter permease [Betaproteobacteria bacterium]|nr:ABC transporter permease [Betaproteobacteria bacterium]
MAASWRTRAIVQPTDAFRFASRAAAAYPVRTGLMMLAMAIGVAAVVVLTALGEGARRYVVSEFSSIGSNLILVFPGRNETGGIAPGMLLGQTARDLTLDDALSLLRIGEVQRLAPIAVGVAETSHGSLSREVSVVGTTADFIDVRKIDVAQGQFLNKEDPRTASSVCVLGAILRDELFGSEPALGRWVRIGDRRFRVVGVMAASGQGLGFNTDEIVFVPVAAAQAMFNTNKLFRILVEAKGREAIAPAKTKIEAAMKARHEGKLDVTVITQDAVLSTFDRILKALTLAVAGIAAISLAVAGILVMNVMLVAITQRTTEIGLLKALGATNGHVRILFFTEAALLSLAGALLGLGLGQAGSALLRQVYPALPAYAPTWASMAGVLIALLTGILFSILPARRAARMDPVQALSKR